MTRSQGAGIAKAAAPIGLRALTDGLSPSVFVGVLLPDGTLMHANRNALKAVGATLADVIGQRFGEAPWWSDPPTRARIRGAIDRARDGSASRFDVVMAAADGSLRTLDFTLMPVRNADGEVAYLVPSATDVTEARAARTRAEHLQYHDALTGLPNRRRLHDRLRERLAQSGAARPAVLMIDLDRFMRFNLALESGRADELLKMAASRIAQCLGARDLLARFGGDEFVVVLGPDDSEPNAAMRKARQLLSWIARPFNLDGQELFITASIGVACANAGFGDADTLLRNASVALDRAKSRGRNLAHGYEADQRVEDPDRIALEAALRRALDHGAFDLHYQPQVDLRSGSIVGVEALLRWRDPAFGDVPPARFIPVAEEAGLIDDIGEWVLRTACERAAAWQRAGLPPVRMMVNVSARQLQNKFVSRVQRILAATELEPRRLGIELTESTLMDCLDDASSRLRLLRDMGIEIALDDFGTGFSCLAQLARLPIDVVKIDRSLVPGAAAQGEALAILRAVIAMSHSLGMRVLAEGVETAEQLELLIADDCDLCQGFRLAVPGSAEAVEAMLRDNAALLGPALQGSHRLSRVLLIDEDADALKHLQQNLMWHLGDALDVEVCSDTKAAIAKLSRVRLDIVVARQGATGLGVDGMEFLAIAKRLQPSALRMLVVDTASWASVVEDLRQVDVFRYLPRLGSREQLLAHFRAALEALAQRRGDAALVGAIREHPYRPGRLSEALRKLDDGAEAAGGGAPDADGAPAPERELFLPTSVPTMPGDLWAGTPAEVPAPDADAPPHLGFKLDLGKS